MPNNDFGPNEWEHQEKAPKEDKSITFVKIIIALGFIPLGIVGTLWLWMTIFQGG